MLHVLSMGFADLQGEAALVSLGGGETPSALAIHGQLACAVTGWVGGGMLGPPHLGGGPQGVRCRAKTRGPRASYSR